MKTFFYVLQKCIKSKQIIYPDEEFVPFMIENYDNNFLDVSPYIYFLIYDIHYIHLWSKTKNPYLRSSKAKLYSLNKLLNNIFISNELKEKILDIFSEAQQKYFSLSKFANIYRYKKWPLIVTNDLTLNPLDINHPSTFVMIQNRSKYLFSMNDLINIIETAICNSPNFFITPLSPKNPYNNQKLNTSILCNIYFKMTKNVCKFSLIFHLFFLDNFVKQNFYLNNEPFLREYGIKKYVYTSPSETLHNAVILMLHNNYYTKKLDIHEEFPKDILVDIFRPYLFCYYIIYYSIIGTEKIYKYKNLLHIKLKKFYKYNPFFGRKIVTTANNKAYKKFVKSSFKINFNTDHINFYNIQINNSNNLYRKVSTSSNISNNNTTNTNTRIDHFFDSLNNNQPDPNELFYTNTLTNSNNEYDTNDYDDTDDYEE
jgi:hypothetical protein